MLQGNVGIKEGYVDLLVMFKTLRSVTFLDNTDASRPLPHRPTFFRRSFAAAAPVGRVFHLAPTRRTTEPLTIALEGRAQSRQT